MCTRWGLDSGCRTVRLSTVRLIGSGRRETCSARQDDKKEKDAGRAQCLFGVNLTLSGSLGPQPMYVLLDL